MRKPTRDEKVGGCAVVIMINQADQARTISAGHTLLAAGHVVLLADLLLICSVIFIDYE